MHPNYNPNLPPPPLSTGADQRLQDDEHLKILSVLFWVFGGLNLLCGSFPFLHVFLGIMMVTGRIPTGPGQPPPPELGWLFIGVGLTIILIAWTIGLLLVMTGFNIRKRKARTFCQVMACLACLSFPIGTALGVFALIVLSRPSVRQQFEGNP